jgi:hypothetical protein
MMGLAPLDTIICPPRSRVSFPSYQGHSEFLGPHLHLSHNSLEQIQQLRAYPNN